jgi:hypothetical protein
VGLIDSNRTYGEDQSAVVDVINDSGVSSALIVGTVAIEIKVGSSRLQGRKSVTLFNNSNSTLYWGYSPTITVATGSPIFKQQLIEWSVGDAVAIYIIAGNNNNDTRITEAA